MSQGSFTKVTGGGEKERHPKGLYVLFATEMWERFSFYLMIGIFGLYLTDSHTGGMGWSEEKAASIIGSYIGLVYFTPFLGGLIADRLLGYRKTIILGGIFFIIGHVTLAFEGELTLYLALLCLIIGNGLFKPNISTLVGRLYPQGSPLRDGAYTIFYMGINIGAFACNFIAAIVRNEMHGVGGIAGWHWAFATAGVGMAIGVITFLLFHRKHLAHVDITDEERAKEPQQSLTPLWVECLAPAVGFGVMGWLLQPSLAAHVELSQPTMAFLFACIPVVFFYLRLWLKIQDRTERGRVAALLTIFGVVIVFWMIFHQNSTALTFWARDNTDRQPSSLIEPVVDAAPAFSEKAPPDYFENAGPEVPRPDPSMFRIVTSTGRLAGQVSDTLVKKGLDAEAKELNEDGTPKEIDLAGLQALIATFGVELEALPPERMASLQAVTPTDEELTALTWATDASVVYVLDDARWKMLTDAGKLGLHDVGGTQRWVVTPETFHKVYAGKDAAGAKTLPPGQQLKLVNTELFQSINGGFVILFAPLLAALWVFLARRRREPSTPAKIATGLFITGLSALVMVGAVSAAGVPEGKVSAWWLFGTYAVVTVGELCLSPIGLSLVSKLAPRRIAAFMMGGWFLSTSIGNKLSGVMGETYTKWDHTNFFLFNAACAAGAAALIFALLPWLRRQMAMPSAPPPDTTQT